MRHGRTAWNAEGRFQGQTDISLDATGRAQARALGAFLSGEGFDAVVSSDLARARETAELILGRTLLAAELDPLWREMKFGAWEGLTWPEIVARFPELDDARPSNVPKFATPQGGESFEQVCARVERALAALRARVPSAGKALVVTHAGAVHATLRVLFGGDGAEALRARFEPASVTRLALGPAGARVVSLNETPPEVEVA